jgi:hypothetical protein
MTLQKGCKNIMKADGKVLSGELYNKQRKGIKVSNTLKCSSCHLEIQQSNEESIVFFCSHSYHSSCLEHDFNEPKITPFSRIHCLVCHNKEEIPKKNKK